MTLRSTNILHKKFPAILHSLLLQIRINLTFVCMFPCFKRILIALRTFRFISPSLSRGKRDTTPYLLCSCQFALPKTTVPAFAIRILCEKACCPLRQLTYDITAKKFRQAIFEDNFTFFKEIAGNFPFYHVYFAHKRARAYAQNLEIRKKAASLFGQGNRNTFIAFSDTGLPDR